MPWYGWLILACSVLFVGGGLAGIWLMTRAFREPTPPPQPFRTRPRPPSPFDRRSL